MPEPDNKCDVINTSTSPQQGRGKALYALGRTIFHTSLGILLASVLLTGLYYMAVEFNLPSEAFLVIGLVFIIAFWRFRKVKTWHNALFSTGVVTFSLALLISLMNWFV